MSNVLQCAHLSKEFVDGDNIVHVLQDVNLKVAKGEMVAILGASGSGKSTLLQCLGLLDTPTAGDILIVGESATNLSEKQKCLFRNRHLGFVYQFHHLMPEFTTLENVAMPLLIRGANVRDARQQAEEWLVKVGLKERLHFKVMTLSGGERQRAAMARALINRPACVLADEPMGNLDHHTAHQVFETLLNLQSETQTSFVIVTHDQSIADRVDRVLVLEKGLLN
ncbi:MAG: ABC transporter ATP-binding protein [Gammaproteobacteria bacterium]